MEGLRRHQDRVRFVLVHHEEAAAFMATAHAKATGRIGVCLATSGPGGIHLLNGLYDAKLDHMPVLAIPALVDVNVNPDEPPLPGKVEYQQAKKFAEAFLRGQPRKATIATTLFRDKIEQLKG